jgi:methyl-accepting chemotaxis protein PixJ
MFKKNLFGSTDDRSDKTTDTLHSIAPSIEQQQMSNLDRTAMNNTTAKQQLLSILQDTQVKLENSNNPNTEPLRQNLRKARELAGFLTVASPANAPVPVPSIDAEQVYQIATRIRQAGTPAAAFSSAVSDIKTLMNVDRVLIYELTGTTGGTVVAEAVQTGFTPTFGAEIPQIGFGFEQLTDDRSHRAIALINSQISPYQKQIFDQYQVQSTVTIPILINGYSATTDIIVWVASGDY